MRLSQVVLSIVAVVALSLQLAHAGSIQSFEAITSNVYSSDGVRLASDSSSNEFYTVGFQQGFFGNPGQELRSFLLFDLANLTIPEGEQVGSVTLVLDTQLYRSPHEGELVRFYDVTTPIDTLRNGSAMVSAFDDLGEGTLYGGRLYRPADSLQTLSIPLFTAAADAVELARGTVFGIGFRMESIAFDDHTTLSFDEFVFGGGVLSGIQRLDVLVAVPEPRGASFWTSIPALFVFVKPQARQRRE